VSSYLSWSELEEELEAPASTEPDAPSGLGIQGADAELLKAVPDAARDRLSLLMTQRAKLEQQLLRLLGKAPPDAEEQRRNALFPMPVHTAESRLAQRKAEREEQRARALARRAQEASRLRIREEAERQQGKREAERRRLRALAAARADARRAFEQHEDWLRGLRLQEGIRARWAEQREVALRAQQVARARMLKRFEGHDDRRRERALQSLHERQKAEAELSARLDRRGRTKSWRDD